MNTTPLPPTEPFALARLGLDASRPMYDLNLAGSQGTPPIPSLPSLHMAEPVRSEDSSAPDFGVPNVSFPTLKPYDLVTPGITSLPAFSPDLALPTLEDYNQPYDLDIVNAQYIRRHALAAI